MDGGQRYLICEKCGGYYQLQPEESPEDFEKCQCGGNLKYTKQLTIPPNTKTKDKINSTKNSTNKNLKIFNKKQGLILIGFLALIIIVISIISTQNVVSTNTTLIETYNVSNIGQDPNGTIIDIPQGTTDIKIEYNLSWTPVSAGTNGIIIDGYNTNVTGGASITHFNGNIIYYKAFQLHKDDQNKIGTLNIDGSGLKSLVISQNGINGTIKIYAYEHKMAL